MRVDTIYALATPLGRSAIGVIRLSGPDSFRILETISRKARPETRRAVRRDLHDPASGSLIDEAMAVCFQGPASYTGEDVVEISVHGGTAVIESVLDSLEGAGARLAEPGEFSRRALMAGKLDLTQAEGVAELIDAETTAQRIHAVDLLKGALGRAVSSWRDQLVKAMAILESSIDFVDEALGDHWPEVARESVARLIAELRDSLSDADNAEEVFAPARVVLVGAPNVGKSSFLNAVTGRETAIVSEIAGTTRDLVRDRVGVGDAVLEIVDTAGLRDTDDPIESIGVARAAEEAERAHYVVLLVSADTWSERTAMDRLLDRADLVLWTKSDIGPMSDAARQALATRNVEEVSVRDESARNVFKRFAAEMQRKRVATISPIAGSKRRARLVASAVADLESAVAAVKAGGIETAVEHLRSGAENLSALIGRVDNEQVLDDVFSRFCIGK